MSALLRSVLDSSGPVIGPITVFITALLGVLVVYLGVAMTTALFHHDRAHRVVALTIFRELLALLTRRAR